MIVTVTTVKAIYVYGSERAATVAKASAINIFILIFLFLAGRSLMWSSADVAHRDLLAYF